MGKQLKSEISQYSILMMAFGLLFLSPMAEISVAKWVVQINGGVDKNVNLTLYQLHSMPRSNVFATLKCNGVFVDAGVWTGVRLALLLETAEYNKEAKSIDFYASDGYSINIPIETAMLDNVIIAFEKDNEPLRETLRLVVPGANGAFWIHSITSIAVSVVPHSPHSENPMRGAETLPKSSTEASNLPPTSLYIIAASIIVAGSIVIATLLKKTGRHNALT